MTEALQTFYNGKTNKRDKAVKNERLFARKLAKLRKEKGFTQQALADAVGIHITQLDAFGDG